MEKLPIWVMLLPSPQATLLLKQRHRFHSLERGVPVDEKGMLTLPTELVKRIDEGRGEQSQSEFLGSLVDSYLEGESWAERFVTQEAFHEFEQGMKELMRSFLNFFVSYGLELGQRPGEDREEALNQRLQRLRTTPNNGSKGKSKG